jgi:hypothetical protein
VTCESQAGSYLEAVNAGGSSVIISQLKLARQIAGSGGSKRLPMAVSRVDGTTLPERAGCNARPSCQQSKAHANHMPVKMRLTWFV